MLYDEIIGDIINQFHSEETLIITQEISFFNKNYNYENDIKLIEEKLKTFPEQIKNSKKLTKEIISNKCYKEANPENINSLLLQEVNFSEKSKIKSD